MVQEVFSPDFFKHAMPEAALWGRIALSVGMVGFAASILLVLLHLRDQLSLKRGQHNPNQYRAPKWGPLSQALAEFFNDPVRNAPLSPDAAAEYIIGRLEAQRDNTQSMIRYFSYAPLLFGLMGTILALRALLVLSGNTLQQIQPQLAGVFAGTLAGIIGSLLAAVGGLILDSSALRTINRAQDFIHRYILPILPERRISIRVEDAVLALITERTRAVAESFNNAMQPVAAQMAQIAVRCGNAAEAATKAFAEAASAVREAGDWEIASRNFKSGAHMIDSSAEQLSDATKQTAEVILRVGEIRQSFTELLDRIYQTSENLRASSSGVAETLKFQMAELNTQGSTLQTTLSTLYSAIDALCGELVRRATSDSAHLEAIKSHTEAAGSVLVSIAEMSRESSGVFKMLPAKVEAISGNVTEGVQQGLTAGMSHLGEQVARTFDKVVVSLERSAEALSKSVNEAPSPRERETTVTSVEFAATIREAATELRRSLEECRKITEVLHDAQRTRDQSPPKKNDGFFRRLWG